LGPSGKQKEQVVDYPFGGMKDPVRRAERYRKVADEYSELAEGASSPSIRAYFERIAQQYREHAEGELRILDQDGAADRKPAS
jgi:hypothetical protein